MLIIIAWLKNWKIRMALPFKICLMVGLCWVGFATFNPAWSVTPEEQLSNPVLENRARELSKIIRCLVCQNQSIDDSDAQLAKDLRILLRERLVAGDSDEQVKQYLVNRYGNYVLFEPPMTAATLLLWGAPLLFIGLAITTYGLWWRHEQKRMKAP